MSEAVQSVQRAVDVLRAVGDLAAESGCRLVDVTTRTGLSRSTVYRLLTALVTAGLVDQDASGTLYFLGLDLVALGGVASRRYGLVDLAADSTQRLADRTGDTIYLSVRDGTEAVCVDRVVGAYPIKTLTLKLGDRRPLGIGAGALALLAALKGGEIEETLRANAAALRDYPQLDGRTLLELVLDTQTRGYAYNDGRIVSGMSAIGLPIYVAGEPMAALSVASVSSRIEGDRIETIRSWVAEEVRRVEERLHDLTGGSPALARRVLRPAVM